MENKCKYHIPKVDQCNYFEQHYFYDKEGKKIIDTFDCNDDVCPIKNPDTLKEFHVKQN